MRLEDLLSRKAKREQTVVFQTTQTERQVAPKPPWAKEFTIRVPAKEPYNWRLPLDDNDFSWAYVSERMRIPFLKGFEIKTFSIGGKSVPLVLYLENPDALLQVLAPIYATPPTGKTADQNYPAVFAINSLLGPWEKEEGRARRILMGAAFFNQDESLGMLRNLLRIKISEHLSGYSKVLVNPNVFLQPNINIDALMTDLQKSAQDAVIAAYEEVAQKLKKAAEEALSQWWSWVHRANATIEWYYAKAAGLKPPTDKPPFELPPGIEVKKDEKTGQVMWSMTPGYLPAPGTTYAVPPDAYRRIFVVYMEKLTDALSILDRARKVTIPQQIPLSDQETRAQFRGVWDDVLGEGQLVQLHAYLTWVKGQDMWKWMPQELRDLTDKVLQKINEFFRNRYYIPGWAVNNLSQELANVIDSLVATLPAAPGEKPSLPEFPQLV